MSSWVHPGAILIIGSVIIPFLKGKTRQVYLLVLPVLAFLSVVSIGEGTYGVYHILGQEMTLARVDKLSLVFGYVFTIAAFIWTVYGLHVKEGGHHLASFVYAGSALGVVFAGDFLTLFIFWEFMAFSSVFLILYRKTKASYEASLRYILVHVFGGITLLGGIVLQYASTHSFAFNPMELTGLPAALILIGFILNAAVPPLSAWLPDAYPQATVAGAVFMITFTTKTAVYVLARGFAGTEILIWLGAIMTVYGILYAFLENDIRRLLAYHIISQVGFMVVGVGIGTELSVNGATAHAITNIIYKGLLFMGAGSVIYMTGRSKLTELGGLYKTMPLTFIFFSIGGFAISAVPLLSGFVSKSMVLSAAQEEHLSTPWLLMTLASSGTFLSISIKLAYYAFMGEDKGIAAKDPPLNMLAGMAIAAFLCIAIGVYPDMLYSVLPYPAHYEPYTAAHVVWTMEILLLTWLGFYIYMKELHLKPLISLDTDWFYRKGARVFMAFADRVVAAADGVVNESYKRIILAPGAFLAGRSFFFDTSVVDGIVNGTADFITALSSFLRRLQTGLVHDYAISLLVGLFILVNVFFFLF